MMPVRAGGQGDRVSRRPVKRQATTCGNWQPVCSPTKAERLENYETLYRSGVVLEGPEFGLVVDRGKSPG